MGRKLWQLQTLASLSDLLRDGGKCPPPRTRTLHSLNTQDRPGLGWAWFAPRVSFPHHPQTEGAEQAEPSAGMVPRNLRQVEIV